jgi:mRNA-degrading endonuclease RelE of RelBE toxin-antitoxin system
MKFSVVVLQRAWTDADRMYEWIASKSPQGARQWHRSFEDALLELQWDAELHSLAPENVKLNRNIRQKIFRTRRGRPYRLIFAIAGKDVHVLCVRGPGQEPVNLSDISE